MELEQKDYTGFIIDILLGSQIVDRIISGIDKTRSDAKPKIS